MAQHDDLAPEEIKRRNFLMQILATATFLGTGVTSAPAKTENNSPKRGIHLIEGKVYVNEIEATINTPILANDRIKTGKNGRLVFAVGHDAFILRNNTELVLESNGLLVGGLRLVTGKLLGVFGKSNHQISTNLGLLGIRGTGLYAEAEPDLTYFCTCYGETDISSIALPNRVITVKSKHHDAPKYITASGEIKPAPFINHTDEELMLIESLVGRTTPFAAFDDDYSGPNKY
jgi:hypothetical protein